MFRGVCEGFKHLSSQGQNSGEETTIDMIDRLSETVYAWAFFSCAAIFVRSRAQSYVCVVQIHERGRGSVEQTEKRDLHINRVCKTFVLYVHVECGRQCG